MRLRNRNQEPKDTEPKRAYKRHDRLSPAQELQLVKRYQKSLEPQSAEPDNEALEHLLLAHTPLIAAVARTIQARNPQDIDYDDLISEGHIAMMEGLKRYNPDAGARVGTYCVWWIRSGMNKAVRRYRYAMAISQRKYSDLVLTENQPGTSRPVPSSSGS